MNSMILILLLLVSLVNLIVFMVALFRIKTVYSQFQAFITPIDDKQGSPLYQLVDALSQVFSRTLIAQAKSIFMAKESGIVRGQNSVDSALADDMLQASSPILAGLLAQFPSVAKTLKRNPALLNYAMEKLASKLPGGSPGSPTIIDGNHKSNNTEQVKFDM